MQKYQEISYSGVYFIHQGLNSNVPLHIILTTVEWDTSQTFPDIFISPYYQSGMSMLSLFVVCLIYGSQNGIKDEAKHVVMISWKKTVGYATVIHGKILSKQ